MALIECNYSSESLGLATSMTVILPQRPGFTGKHRTLYLLHGLSDNHSMWVRRTSLERYADAHGIAVVMPEVHRSFYANMKQGLNYWTFISEELPALARSFFPLSDRREDNYVAGLSMGGYGAFKLGLSFPERYAAAASLSGALDMENWVRDEEEYGWVFGSQEEFRGSGNDLFHLAEAAAARSADPKIRLYQCCGTEDYLYEYNQRFLKHGRKLELDLTYEEEPGAHSWDYWDLKIQRVLEWLEQ